MAEPEDAWDDLLGAAHADLLRRPDIATCTLVRSDGRVHSTPIKMAPVIDGTLMTTVPSPTATALISSSSVKARIVRAGERAGRTVRLAFAEHTSTLWLSLEGPARLGAAPEAVVAAREAHRDRFGEAPTWGDVALVLHVEQVLTGS